MIHRIKVAAYVLAIIALVVICGLRAQSQTVQGPIRTKDVEGVKYVNERQGATVALRVAATCAEFAAAGKVGLAVVPNTEPTGDYTPIDGCVVKDERLTGGWSSDDNVYTTNWPKAITFKSHWTDPNSLNPRNQTFSTVRVYTSNPQGGIYKGSLGEATYKSNYITMMINTFIQAAGQHTGLSVQNDKGGVGDNQAFAAIAQGMGGDRLGFGSEGQVSIRGAVRQRNSLFSATAAGVSGNIITLGGTILNLKHLGAGVRWILNKTSGLCTSSTGTGCTGTTASVASTTVTGVGTTWLASAMAANPTDYCFSLDADEADQNGMKYAIPITTVVDDDTITLSIAYSPYGTTTAGNYKFLRCSEVSLVTATTVTVLNGALFTTNDLIESPISHLYYSEGMKNEDGRQFLTSNITAGYSHGNTCTARRCTMGHLFSLSGNYNRLMEHSSYTFRPQYAFLTTAGAGVAMHEFWWAGNTTSTAQVYYPYILTTGDRAGSTQFRWTTATNDFCWFQSTASAFATCSNPSGMNFSVGAVTQAGTQAYVATTGTNKGLVVNGNTTGNVAEFQIAGSAKVTINNSGMTMATPLNGALAQGTAFKAASVTTGSIALSTSAAVTLTFSGVFTSSSWIPNCSVMEATTSTSTLRIHHIESITNTTNATVVVRIVNDDGAGAHTGTLFCTGVSP